MMSNHTLHDYKMQSQKLVFSHITLEYLSSLLPSFYMKNSD